jgi:Outer membrane lipoprotein-sorting protein
VRTQVKMGIPAAIVVMLIVSSSAAAEQPSAREILENARMNQTEQHRVLPGRLRHAGEVIPFRLVLKGDIIRYQFPASQDELLLRLGERASQLQEISAGDTATLTKSRMAEAIRDTDISYEDLALKFLYWPYAKIVGDEVVLTRRCWKLELHPASAQGSQYGTVLLWVEKESGAMLRAEAYGVDGKLRRRFEVRSVQRADGGWILKQMRIQSKNADQSWDKTPTYLEIEG